MIELRAEAGRLVAEGQLEGRAFADRTWLVPGPLRAVVVRDGSVELPDGTRLAAEGDPAAVAAATFAALAEAAVAAAGADAPAGPRRANGDGLLARLVDARANSSQAGGEEPPAAVVETTGDPAAIAAALPGLARLGVLVVAAPPSGRVDLDLYSDVHVRGLRIVGAGPTQEQLDAAVSAAEQAETPAGVRLGTPFDPPAAGWVEITT